MNVPFAAAIFVAAVRLVPESRDPHPAGFDLVGALLSIVGLAALVYGIIDSKIVADIIPNNDV